MCRYSRPTQTELLDQFTPEDRDTAATQTPSVVTEPSAGTIGFGSASFKWSREGTTSSKRTFVLRIKNELQFLPDKINLVVGPTGSGKTSLLMALLGRSSRSLELLEII